MSEFDISIEDQIAALHAEADELSVRARYTTNLLTKDSLRRAATRKVRQAARLRAQAGVE